MNYYNPTKIECKWQKIWSEKQSHQSEINSNHSKSVMEYKEEMLIMSTYLGAYLEPLIIKMILDSHIGNSTLSKNSILMF